MAARTSKLDHHPKLETEFGDGYVVNMTYEWGFSMRQPTGLSKWKQEKLIGVGAFGSVWLERKDGGRGQLRAVKWL